MRTKKGLFDFANTTDRISTRASSILIAVVIRIYAGIIIRIRSCMYMQDRRSIVKGSCRCIIATANIYYKTTSISCPPTTIWKKRSISTTPILHIK